MKDWSCVEGAVLQAVLAAAALDLARRRAVRWWRRARLGCVFWEVGDTNRMGW